MIWGTDGECAEDAGAGEAGKGGAVLLRKQ